MNETEIQSNSPPPVPAAVPAVRPWGYWATIGWTFLILLGYILAQAAGMVLYVAWKSALNGGHLVRLENLENSGMVIALATLCAAPVAVGLALLFAWLRRGISVREYLGLNWPGWRTAGRWCVFVLAFMAVSDFVTAMILKRPIVPEVMIDAYRTAEILPLLWV